MEPPDPGVRSCAMSEYHISTDSVAPNALETDPIVLRETSTTRLVFKAMIVDKEDSPVRGCFVWQRSVRAMVGRTSPAIP